MQFSNRAAGRLPTSHRRLSVILDWLRDACLRLFVTGGTIAATVLLIVVLSRTGAEIGSLAPDAADEFPEPKTSVYALALTHDDRHLISLEGTGRIVIRETRSDRTVDRFQLPEGLVLSVACSPTAPRAAFGTAEGDIVVLTTDVTGETEARPVRIAGAHEGIIAGLAYCPAGRFIASSGPDGVRLWESLSGEPGSLLQSAEVGACCVAFSPDRHLVLAGLADGSVGLWNPETGEDCGRLVGHSQEIKAVAVCPDSRHACTSGMDGALCLWDLSTRTIVWKQVTDESYTLALAFTPDGRLVASGGIPHPRIIFRDARTGTPIGELGGHRDGIRCLEFTADGRALFSGSYDGRVGHWPMPAWLQSVTSNLASDEQAEHSPTALTY